MQQPNESGFGAIRVQDFSSSVAHLGYLFMESHENVPNLRISEKKF